jgi:hypothetical protein
VTALGFTFLDGSRVVYLFVELLSYWTQSNIKLVALVRFVFQLGHHVQVSEIYHLAELKSMDIF